MRLCSVWKYLFTNIYKCDVIMTSSAAMNIYFLHCQNLLFLRYIPCNFCLNLLVTHGDTKENVDGCFFLNTVCNPFVQPSSTLLAWFIGTNQASPSCLHKGVVLMGLLSGICRLLRVFCVFCGCISLACVLLSCGRRNRRCPDAVVSHTVPCS